ncbi:MAG: ester cyclase [Gemmatimonadetes bacterium]|nr:ester cyclase [Gemmatimonadota bacterium]
MAALSVIAANGAMTSLVVLVISCFPSWRSGKRRNYLRWFGSAYADYMGPDFTNHIEDVVSEGDRSFARLTYRGTHRGEALRIPASGRRIEYAGAALFRLRDGRIAEAWVLGDVHGLLRQLGGEVRGGVGSAEGPTRGVASAYAGSRFWIPKTRVRSCCRETTSPREGRRRPQRLRISGKPGEAEITTAECAAWSRRSVSSTSSTAGRTRGCWKPRRV